MRNHKTQKHENKTALGDFWDVSKFLLFGLYHFMRAHAYLWGKLRDCITQNFDKHWSKCLVLAWIPSQKHTLWQGFENKLFIQKMILGTTSRGVGGHRGKGRPPMWDALLCRLPPWAAEKIVYNITQSHSAWGKKKLVLFFCQPPWDIGQELLLGVKSLVHLIHLVCVRVHPCGQGKPSGWVICACSKEQ